MIPHIEIDPGEGLLIEWPDGHQSRYPFASLRDMCPCAACKDARPRRGAGLRVLASGSDPGAANRFVRAVPVGNYAIEIFWGDGHNTGIYSWEYLRENCACLGCRMGRGREER